MDKKKLAKMGLEPMQKFDAASFAALPGETFAGLNILKLEPDTGAGPFVLSQILKDQNLSKKGGKKIKPVDVYVARDAAGIEVRMPVAASFIGKAQDASLAIGDTFAVFRTADYTSTYGTKGKGFNLTILTRAK